MVVVASGPPLAVAVRAKGSAQGEILLQTRGLPFATARAACGLFGAAERATAARAAAAAPAGKAGAAAGAGPDGAPEADAAWGGPALTLDSEGGQLLLPRHHISILYRPLGHLWLLLLLPRDASAFAASAALGRAAAVVAAACKAAKEPSEEALEKRLSEAARGLNAVLATALSAAAAGEAGDAAAAAAGAELGSSGAGGKGWTTVRHDTLDRQMMLDALLRASFPLGPAPVAAAAGPSGRPERGGLEGRGGSGGSAGGGDGSLLSPRASARTGPAGAATVAPPAAGVVMDLDAFFGGGGPPAGTPPPGPPAAGARGPPAGPPPGSTPADPFGPQDDFFGGGGGGTAAESSGGPASIMSPPPAAAPGARRGPPTPLAVPPGGPAGPWENFGGPAGPPGPPHPARPPGPPGGPHPPPPPPHGPPHPVGAAPPGGAPPGSAPHGSPPELRLIETLRVEARGPRVVRAGIHGRVEVRCPAAVPAGVLQLRLAGTEAAGLRRYFLHRTRIRPAEQGRLAAGLAGLLPHQPAPLLWYALPLAGRPLPLLLAVSLGRRGEVMVAVAAGGRAGAIVRDLVIEVALPPALGGGPLTLTKTRPRADWAPAIRSLRWRLPALAPGGGAAGAGPPGMAGPPGFARLRAQLAGLAPPPAVGSLAGVTVTARYRLEEGKSLTGLYVQGEGRVAHEHLGEYTVHV